MCLAGERRGKCTGFWWENPTERYHFEDHGVYGRMGSDWIPGRLDAGYRLDPVDSG
jgi:hypothetical protein